MTPIQRQWCKLRNTCVIKLSRTGEWTWLVNSPRAKSHSPRVTGECNSRALMWLLSVTQLPELPYQTFNFNKICKAIQNITVNQHQTNVHMHLPIVYNSRDVIIICSDWEEIFDNGPFSAFFNDFEIFNGPFLITLHRLWWAIFQVNGTMAHGPLPSQSLNMWATLGSKVTLAPYQEQ